MTGELAYGVGLAHRPFYLPHLMQNRDAVDFLEVPTEDWIVRSRRMMNDPTGEELKEVAQAFPCVGHGISLSLGSVEPLNETMLRDSRKFLDEYGMAEFSEHLTYHRMNRKDLTVFMSLPFEDAAARWVAHQYNAAREIIKQPFGLEIVAYSFPVDGSLLSEVEFINRVAEYTDCWLLLDAANLFINAYNHKYDPIQYLKDLPGERIQHMHIAGGHYDAKDDEWLDSHSQPVPKEVFDLMDAAMEHTSARAIILERDAVPEQFDTVLEDLRQAREIFNRHRPATRPEDLTNPAGVAWQAVRELPEFGMDSLPEDIEGMRQYQLGVVQCVFDMADGKYQGMEPSQIMDQFAMPEAWKARWRQMNWKSMIKLSGKLRGIVADDKETEQHYRMAELGQWAEMLGQRHMAGG